MSYPNWFAMYADQYFDRHLSPLARQDGLRFLQIGAFTGDASLWLCDNVLTADDATLTDVDTWLGSNEPAHDALNFADVEDTYDEKTAELQATHRIRKRKSTSLDYLRNAMPRQFDFIYIDGDHTAPGVLNDAVHAIPLLRDGGLLAFDDYRWRSSDGSVLHSPALAIDTVRIIYNESLTLLELDAQAWFRLA